MENASKALIIAGGVLLALMVLSLVVYMSTATTRFAEAQDQKKLTEEITAFNNGYTAYNKKRMYGTDIITVVNKAIEHNKRMLARPVDNPYYINIRIYTIEEFQTTVDEIDNREEYPDPKTLRGTQITDSIKANFRKTNSFGAYLGKNITSTLGTWDESGEDFIMDSNFLNFFEGDTNDEEVTVNNGEKTYIMYSALTNFKRAIFECTDVIYNEETGRIKEMKFSQIKKSSTN